MVSGRWFRLEINLWKYFRITKCKTFVKKSSYKYVTLGNRQIFNENIIANFHMENWENNLEIFFGFTWCWLIKENEFLILDSRENSPGESILKIQFHFNLHLPLMKIELLKLSHVFQCLWPFLRFKALRIRSRWAKFCFEKF